jgi:DNA-binding SARP family transcriptional activator
VLGQFQLLVGDAPTPLPLQAQRVLGLLAVAGSPQTRSAVAGTLWSEAREQQAKAALRNAVWRIQSVAATVLRCTRAGVSLDEAVLLDLDEAQRCARDLVYGAAAATDAHAVDVLDRDVLPTWDEDWVVVERERQRQLRMHALESMSSVLCRRGRFPEAIAAALAAVDAEPLRESAQRALITAHLAEGNVSEAVRQMDLYRRLLAHEMGIAPSRQLQQLVGAALGATRALAGGPSASGERVAGRR